jgi:hypothetical protein
MCSRFVGQTVTLDGRFTSFVSPPNAKDTFAVEPTSGQPVPPTTFIGNASTTNNTIQLTCVR